MASRSGKHRYGARSRHRGDDSKRTYVWKLTFKPSGSSVSANQVTTCATHCSDMTDYTGPGRLDQPCFHTKFVSVLQTPPTAVRRIGTPPPPIPPMENWIEGPVGWELPVGLFTELSLVSDYQRFLTNATYDFKQQFRAKVSLANFVYELKDFKNVIDELKPLANPRNWNKNLSRNIGNLLHGRARSGASGNYLDVVFNWKPFFEDIPKLFSAYADAMKRLQFLIDRGKFVDHRRIRFQIEPYTKGFNDISVLDVKSLFSPSYQLPNYTIKLVPQWAQVTMNASAYMDNKLDLLCVSRWWAIADQLGLNNSVKIAWNAIKLSWLVDFFVETKDLLNAFEVQAYGGGLGIEGGCGSVKMVRSYKASALVSSPTGDILVPFGDVLVTTYRRDLLRPLSGSLLSFADPLTDDQSKILIALASSSTGGERRLVDTISKRFARNRHTFGTRGWIR